MITSYWSLGVTIDSVWITSEVIRYSLKIQVGYRLKTGNPLSNEATENIYKQLEKMESLHLVFLTGFQL